MLNWAGETDDDFVTPQKRTTADLFKKIAEVKESQDIGLARVLKAVAELSDKVDRHEKRSAHDDRASQDSVR